MIPLAVTTRRAVAWAPPAPAPGDVVVVTSPFAATVAAALAGRIAAVGAATAARLTALGRPPDVVSPDGTAAGLAAAIGPCPRILWPRAAEPTPGTREALLATGATVVDGVVYETVPAQGLGRVDADVVVWTAGSAARALAAAWAGPWPKAVAIGPATASAARAAGAPVDVVADTPDAEGILRAITRLRGR